MATFGISIYIDSIKISDTKFIAGDDFEITSTGLVINGTQVWTYSGNLVFDGFTQAHLNSPVGTTGNLSDFEITSNKYIYLNTLAHAEYYKASYADLSSVANTIRNKSGALNKLEFPTGFVSAIEDLANVATAFIEVEVANGTATITSGEFPDWCTEENAVKIWGNIYINSGFVAEGFQSNELILRIAGVVEADGEVDAILSYSPTTGYLFAVSKDLSMIRFFMTASEDSAAMTSGTFGICLFIYDPFDQTESTEPTEPITPNYPVEDNDPAV